MINKLNLLQALCFENKNMETFQNTRESFTDEEDVPNIQIPVTTNTSTTSRCGSCA